MTFEDKLSWILTDFKNDRNNFGGTIQKIEQAVIESLGIFLYTGAEVDKIIEIQEKKWDDERDKS